MARMPELLPEVTDSKRLTPGARAVMAVQISQIALGVGVGHSLPGEIDSLGILLATRLAMLRALRALALPVDFVIVDGPPLVRLSALLPDARQEHIVDGDRRVLSVAAASIVAKVARDGIMSRLEGSRARARYGFRRHKGYGTPDHVRALLQFGSSPYHRLTWRPMRLLGARESIPQLHHG
jgi:ribonuclease HII